MTGFLGIFHGILKHLLVCCLRKRTLFSRKIDRGHPTKTLQKSWEQWRASGFVLVKIEAFFVQNWQGCPTKTLQKSWEQWPAIANFSLEIKAFSGFVLVKIEAFFECAKSISGSCGFFVAICWVQLLKIWRMHVAFRCNLLGSTSENLLDSIGFFAAICWVQLLKICWVHFAFSLQFAGFNFWKLSNLAFSLQFAGFNFWKFAGFSLLFGSNLLLSISENSEYLRLGSGFVMGPLMMMMIIRIKMMVVMMIMILMVIGLQNRSAGPPFDDDGDSEGDGDVAPKRERCGWV